MAQEALHRDVQFAQRYARQFEPTLNALTAIGRAEALLGDICVLQNINRLSEIGRWPEIFSYYAVGFVTCLEWHARSRTVDLFTYKPGSATKKDFDAIGNERLSQIPTANVTVAHLLGAMVKVNSLESYIQRFDRLFFELGIAESPSRVIDGVDSGRTDYEGKKVATAVALKELCVPTPSGA
jgi:hypothetical protein